MDLSITIVNTGHIQDTLQCLESIFSGTHTINFEIFVINNACTDGSAEIIRKRFRNAHLINNKNLEGVAANFNKGFRQSRGKYLLMLNEDCIVMNNCLDKIVKFLDENKQVGIASPQIINPDGTLQHQVRRFPGLLTEFMKRFKGKCVPFKIRLSDEYPDYRLMKIFQPDCVGGTAMFFRKEALDTVGFFDESFFIFYEDVDICKRAKDTGWKIVHFPYAKIMHKKWITREDIMLSGKVKEKLRYQLLESGFKYFKKHCGITSIPMLKCIILSDFIVRLIKSSFLYFISKKSRKIFTYLIDLSNFTLRYK